MASKRKVCLSGFSAGQAYFGKREKMYRNIFGIPAILLLLILITGCASQSQNSSFSVVAVPATVPSWFENLPELPGNVMLATGFTGKFEDERLAKSVALNSAQINLAKQKQAQLVFQVEDVSDGRFRLLNPKFKIYYEADILKYVQANCTLIDSVATECGYFVLIACPGLERGTVEGGEAKTWGNRPAWIDKLPESDSWLYGIGIVANYQSAAKAWKDADDFARFDVGKNMLIETESVHYREQNDRFIKETLLMKQAYDLMLYNAMIVAHWYDKQDGVYYSLGRIPR